MALVKANNFRIKSAEKNVFIEKENYYPSISLTGATGSSYSSLQNWPVPTNTIVESPKGYCIKNGSSRTAVYKEEQIFNAEKISYNNQLKSNLGFFTGISVQVPIFNDLQVRNRVKQAKILLRNTQLNAENTNYQLKQSIEQAWLNMNAAYNRYQVLKTQLINFKESFPAAEIRYETGVINTTEFLITKSNLNLTKINLIQSKYEYTFRTKLLGFYQVK